METPIMTPGDTPLPLFTPLAPVPILPRALFISTNGKVEGITIPAPGIRIQRQWQYNMKCTATTSLFFDGRFVYAACAQALCKLDANDGSLIWQTEVLPGFILATARPCMQFLAQDKLAVGLLGYVVLVNSESGKVLWTTNLKGTWHAVVSLSCVDIFGTVFAAANGTVWSLNGETGQVNWNNNLPGCGHGGTTILAGSNASGKVVIYVAVKGNIIILDPMSGETIKQVSSSDMGMGISLYAGNLYASGSTLKMLNSATLETIWINKLKGAGNVCVSAHYHAQFNGANLTFVGIGGFVIGVESFSGAQLWKTSLPGSGYEIVTLMVIDGILYAASNGAMYALTMDTGKIIWQSDLPGLGYLSICMASSGQVTDSNSSQPFCYADDQRSETPAFA